MNCPVCKSEFIQQASMALPFCSDRCRQIDLGRWLNEEYSLPLDEGEEFDEADYSFPRPVSRP